MSSRFTRHFVGAAAAFALASAAVPAQAQDFVNILTGGTSGVYYPAGSRAFQGLLRQGAGEPSVGPGHQGVG